MQALIFDVDGTLVDAVYAHTFAWQKALSEFGFAIARMGNSSPHWNERQATR